jgi:steroid delta-isomerase-like uncharacterized protein
MAHEKIVQDYFAGWNAHDSAAIVSTFSQGGTYADPTTGGVLAGDAIGKNAAQLWAAFPDVKFEIRSHTASPDGRVAAEWIMTGTNTGSFVGLPPTGRKVVLNGADFIDVTEQGIRSVRGYFDAGDLPRQLGLQIVVQPQTVGPFEFGTSARIGGSSSDKPGAFSITSIIPRDEKEVELIREYSRKIAADLQKMQGFLGWVGVTVGDRMVTVTAWRDPEDARQLLQHGLHSQATQSFFGPDLSAGAWTGIFAAHRINAVWSRCRECGGMVRRADEATRCKCGADLGAVPEYW